MPALARTLFAGYDVEFAALQSKIDAINARLQSWLKVNETARRLTDGADPVEAAGDRTELSAEPRVLRLRCHAAGCGSGLARSAEPPGYPHPTVSLVAALQNKEQIVRSIDPGRETLVRSSGSSMPWLCLERLSGNPSWSAA